MRSALRGRHRPSGCTSTHGRCSPAHHAKVCRRRGPRRATSEVDSREAPRQSATVLRAGRSGGAQPAPRDAAVRGLAADGHPERVFERLAANARERSGDAVRFRSSSNPNGGFVPRAGSRNIDFSLPSHVDRTIDDMGPGRWTDCGPDGRHGRPRQRPGRPRSPGCPRGSPGPRRAGARSGWRGRSSRCAARSPSCRPADHRRPGAAGGVRLGNGVGLADLGLRAAGRRLRRHAAPARENLGPIALAPGRRAALLEDRPAVRPLRPAVRTGDAVDGRREPGHPVTENAGDRGARAGAAGHRWCGRMGRRRGDVHRRAARRRDRRPGGAAGAPLAAAPPAPVGHAPAGWPCRS